MPMTSFDNEIHERTQADCARRLPRANYFPGCLDSLIDGARKDADALANAAIRIGEGAAKFLGEGEAPFVIIQDRPTPDWLRLWDEMKRALDSLAFSMAYAELIYNGGKKKEMRAAVSKCWEAVEAVEYVLADFVPAEERDDGH